MPFDPYRSPYGAQIASLLQAPAQAQADALLRVGDLRARQALSQGDRAAAISQGLGATIGQVLQTPMLLRQQQLALQDAQTKRALAGEDLRHQTFQNTQEEQHAEAIKRLGQAMTASRTTTPEGAVQYDVPKFLSMAQQDPLLSSMANEPADAMQKANEAHREWIAGQRKSTVDAVRAIVAGALDAGGTPDDLHTVAQLWIDQGAIKPEAIQPTLLRLVEADSPEKGRALLRGIAGIPEKTEKVGPGDTLVRTTLGETPAPVFTSIDPRQADAARREAEVERHNKETERISGFTAGREVAAQAETARHNRAMEAIGQTNKDPTSAPNQEKLEQQYRGVLLREFSSRSGGLGLEDQKVNQALHLLAIFDQNRDPKTGEYHIPRMLQNELALGLARLTSPSGQVGVELSNELNQRTAKGDWAGLVTYLTGTPVTGSTQDIFKMFHDSIDRQGRVAEQNRETYLNAMRAQAPTDLADARRQQLERGLNLNRLPSTTGAPAGASALQANTTHRVVQNGVTYDVTTDASGKVINSAVVKP